MGMNILLFASVLLYLACIIWMLGLDKSIYLTIILFICYVVYKYYAATVGSVPALF